MTITHQSLLEQLRISKPDSNRRREYFNFPEADTPFPAILYLLIADRSDVILQYSRKETDMIMLQVLKAIEHDLEQIFDRFYREMLANKDFSIFFKDEEQIQNLIKRQKQYFIKSLSVEEEQLKEMYTPLGEMHYDLKLPYVDFSAGMTIMEEGVLRVISRHDNTEILLDAAFQFFRIIRGYTAKGYLNRMLDDDSRDIDLYLENVRRSSEIDTLFATERIIWLKNLIFAIKIENRVAAPPLQLPQQVVESIKSMIHDDPALLHYINGIVSRLEINASNVFFFIENRSYEEVLTLYRELMSLYKLCLMITNVMTIAASNSIINSLNKDALTGLLTRSSLDSIIDREIAIAIASDYPLSFIMFDIDNFKDINETYGHHAGDEVLQTVSEIAHTNIRSTDFAFRIGGEEFLLLLRGASERITVAQAELIRQKIEQQSYLYDKMPYSVTASFGVTTFQRPFIHSFASMLKETDRKLYLSKRNGRNQVTI
jgi:diguanylate cyclase (GGDEF)-like protein